MQRRMYFDREKKHGNPGIFRFSAMPGFFRFDCVRMLFFRNDGRG